MSEGNPFSTAPFLDMWVWMVQGLVKGSRTCRAGTRKHDLTGPSVHETRSSSETTIHRTRAPRTDPRSFGSRLPEARSSLPRGISESILERSYLGSVEFKSCRTTQQIVLFPEPCTHTHTHAHTHSLIRNRTHGRILSTQKCRETPIGEILIKRSTLPQSLHFRASPRSFPKLHATQTQHICAKLLSNLFQDP